jgi:hypothetical protein
MDLSTQETLRKVSLGTQRLDGLLMGTTGPESVQRGPVLPGQRPRTYHHGNNQIASRNRAQRNQRDDLATDP